MQWLPRFFLRRKPHIPDALWQRCTASLPFLDRLSTQDLGRLKSLGEALLDKKTFTGAGGFELNDEIAVLIAAQASLPVLNLTLDLYKDMAGIIVYPGSFIVAQSEMDEAGVVHEWREPISGEAVDAGGAVVLSWEDIEDPNAPGQNVVIHEFAHKIDMVDGIANGCPPFFSACHADINPLHWQRTFAHAYRDFTSRVETVESQLPEDFNACDPDDIGLYEQALDSLPLDPYAARHPAEFFAVASEAFFVLPQPLATQYPEIYRLLSLYYRQSPLKQ